MKGNSEIRLVLHCNTVCDVLQGRKIFYFLTIPCCTSEKYGVEGNRVVMTSWSSRWDMQTTEGKGLL